MSENFILKGPKPVISLLDQNLGELFFQLFSSKNPALIEAETSKKLTYEDLFKKSRRLAFYLQQQGYRKNVIFAISSENNLNFFVIILACFYLGITVAPLNPEYTSTELTQILSIFKPSLIFCTSKNVGTFNEIKLHYNLKIIIIDDLPKILDLTENWKKLEPLKDNPKDLNAFILCSSGTTGLPKGVILSHKNILTRLTHHKDHRYYRQEPGKTIFPVLPFFHGYGLLAVLGGILLQLKIVFLNKFEENLFLNTIETFKVDYLWVTPPLLVFLAKTPLVKNYNVSSIKEILCGAAPLGKPIEKEIRKRFKARFSQGYGLTETTFAIALSSYLKPLKNGSCGQVTPFMSCKVKDLTNGNCLSANKIGELCIKGKKNHLNLNFYLPTDEIICLICGTNDKLLSNVTS